MFNSRLEKIRENLSYRHRDKSDIMEEAIKVRLDKSLTTYTKTLDAGVSYMSVKDEIRVIKKL